MPYIWNKKPLPAVYICPNSVLLYSNCYAKLQLCYVKAVSFFCRARGSRADTAQWRVAGSSWSRGQPHHNRLELQLFPTGTDCEAVREAIFKASGKAINQAFNQATRKAIYKDVGDGIGEKASDNPCSGQLMVLQVKAKHEARYKLKSNFNCLDNSQLRPG